MKNRTKLTIHKVIIIVIIIIGAGFIPISKIVALIFCAIAIIYDQIFRRCPLCGYHIQITQSISEGDHCPGCGKLFDSVYYDYKE